MSDGITSGSLRLPDGGRFHVMGLQAEDGYTLSATLALDAEDGGGAFLRFMSEVFKAPTRREAWAAACAWASARMVPK